MKNDYYFENIIFLHSYLNKELQTTFRNLKFDTNSFIDKFGYNDESIKEHYLIKFNEVKEEILNIKISKQYHKSYNDDEQSY